MDDNQKLQVERQIREAFRGVALGNGVGLREANGMDDYLDRRSLETLRSEDEKHDWSQISASDLNHYCNSLPYFDAEGMRFHLPAYLLADLAGTLQIELLFFLVYPDKHAISKFDLLTPSQRGAVRVFLKLKQIGAMFESEMIKAALDTVWT